MLTLKSTHLKRYHLPWDIPSMVSKPIPKSTNSTYEYPHQKHKITNSIPSHQIIPTLRLTCLLFCKTSRQNSRRRTSWMRSKTRRVRVPGKLMSYWRKINLTNIFQMFSFKYKNLPKGDYSLLHYWAIV